MVTASADCTSKIYDTETGTVRHNITHDSFVNSAQFSPDGRYIVTASRNNTATIYDTGTGTARYTITHNDGIYSGQFSPDNRYVVTASADCTAKIYDLYTQEQKDFFDNEKKPHEDKKMYSSIDILRLRQQEQLREKEVADFAAAVAAAVNDAVAVADAALAAVAATNREQALYTLMQAQEKR